MSHLLEVNNLEVKFGLRFGDLTAINGISFNLDKGQRMGLVGESGAGKSVTGFAIINLISKPGFISGGQVMFNGQDLATLSDEAMREIRKLRGAIEEEFIRDQISRFEVFWGNPVRAENPQAFSEKQELSLVDDEELEENLAVSGMISKAENRYHRGLFALNMRFAQVAGIPDLTYRPKSWTMPTSSCFTVKIDDQTAARTKRTTINNGPPGNLMFFIFWTISSTLGGTPPPIFCCCSFNFSQSQLIFCPVNKLSESKVMTDSKTRLIKMMLAN